LEAIKTKRELLKWAKESLGIEPKQAVDIIKRNGFDGRFDARSMQDYIAILTVHSEKVAIAIERAACTNIVEPILNCPVCGAVVARRQDRDGMFGSVYGWACPTVGHWAEWNWRSVKEWMTRGKDDTREDEEGSTARDEHGEGGDGSGPSDG